MSHIEADDLIAILKRRKLRITAPRRVVCKVIAEHHSEHLTAAAIFEQASRGSGGDIDMATVYRTLDVLEQAGAVQHTHMGHGPTVYHLAEEAHHQHLVCSSCGKTTAVATSDIEALFGTITAATGFVPSGEHFAMSGLCKVCAQIDGSV